MIDIICLKRQTTLVTFSKAFLVASFPRFQVGPDRFPLPHFCQGADYGNPTNTAPNQKIQPDSASCKIKDTIRLIVQYVKVQKV